MAKKAQETQRLVTLTANFTGIIVVNPPSTTKLGNAEIIAARWEIDLGKHNFPELIYQPDLQYNTPADLRPMGGYANELTDSGKQKVRPTWLKLIEEISSIIPNIPLPGWTVKRIIIVSKVERNTDVNGEPPRRFQHYGLDEYTMDVEILITPA